MNTIEMYNNLENIGIKLYQNDNSAWVKLQEVLSELGEFATEVASISEEMKNVVMRVFSSLLDAIQNVDQLLAADIVYYELCELVAVYEKIYNDRDIETHQQSNVNKGNIDTKKTYEINMKCLENKWDGYYQKLIEYCERFDLNDKEVQVDEYGNIAVLKSDRWWRMNSFYNSEYAASLALQEIMKQNYISCLYIFGMGNLDTIRKMTEYLPTDTMIFIYEPNPKIFGVNSYYSDWSEVLNKENVVLFVEGLNDEELAKCTYIRMENIAYQYSYVYIQPEYGKVYPIAINEKLQECQTMIQNAVLTDNTIDKFAEKFNYNRIMNIPYIYKSILATDMKQFFNENIDIENETAILVAAGPSLDENMEYLRKIKGRAFILAVDSSIRMCEAYGVKPDAYVTVDPQKQEILFENKTAQNTPLFWGLQSVHRQVKQLKCRKIFCNMDSYLPDELKGKLEYIIAGGSVANTGFSILKYLGFHKIIAIGLDLAFLNDKKHAAVVYDDGGISEEESRHYTEIKGINGEKLLTYNNFVAYKENIERRIAEDEKLIFVNASKGAYIEGAIHMPFQEAVDKYVPEKIMDFENIIERCPYSYSSKDKAKVERYLLKYAEDCNEIYEIYKECCQVYESMKNMNNTEDVHIAMNKIDTLYANAEQSFAGQLIVDYSSKEADRVLNSMYKESVISEKYSQDNLVLLAEKGMQISKIFMENAKKTKKMFINSMENIQ